MKKSFIQSLISFAIILFLYYGIGKQVSTSFAQVIAFAGAIAVVIYAIYDSKKD